MLKMVIGQGNGQNVLPTSKIRELSEDSEQHHIIRTENTNDTRKELQTHAIEEFRDLTATKESLILENEDSIMCQCDELQKLTTKFQLPTFTREEVACHSDYTSCWIIIEDRVYDVTKFVNEHPGGDEIIMEHAGWDATMSFSDVGHSRDAKDMLEQYFIGILTEEDRSSP